MERIATLPLEEQADAWGELDEKIMTDYFPIIPTAFRNDLFVFGGRSATRPATLRSVLPNYRTST